MIPKKLKKLWLTFKALDNYRRSLIITVPLSIAVVIISTVLDTGQVFHDLVLNDWREDLFTFGRLVSFMYSAAAYFGRLLDIRKLFRKDKKKKKPHISLTSDEIDLEEFPKKDLPKTEYILTILGIILAIGFSIMIAAVHHAVPLLKPLSWFAYALNTVSLISLVGGLGNRFGKLGDAHSRPISEKGIVAAFLIAGLASGIALSATGCASLICIAGVTSFFTAGAAAPLWLAILGGLLFVIGTTSVAASAGDYTAKTVSFLRHKHTANEEVKATVKEKFHEYRGAMIGMIIGVVFAIIVISAIAPYLAPGFLGIVTAGFILLSGVSFFGSLCSRFNRMFDKIHFPKTKGAEEETAKQSTQHTPPGNTASITHGIRQAPHLNNGHTKNGAHPPLPTPSVVGAGVTTVSHTPQTPSPTVSVAASSCTTFSKPFRKTLSLVSPTFRRTLGKNSSAVGAA